MAEGTVETVHLVFKTHLDLGFTDLASAVLRRYTDEFIPAALELARTLRESGSPYRFVWTTGSWLIDHVLEHGTPAERQAMESAIAAGDMHWHALPFTLHSELLDAKIFRFGLSLAQRLDRRFGRETIAAKMTDVPGHSRAIVPLLAEAGVTLLHIGVNEASTMPDVPPAFVWRDPASDHEIMVIYEHHYGGVVRLPGLDHALAVQMTGDNLGPPTREGVARAYRTLRARFPSAAIVPGSLDDFARAMETIRPSLPVITAEIGDSWIHGAGSDPQKVRAWRDLMRLNRQIAAAPGSLPTAAHHAFQMALLCIGEHTWGLDTKLHLHDFVSYTAAEFAAVRTAPPFQHMERSWSEQRAYLHQAVAALDGTPWHAPAAERVRAALHPARRTAPPGTPYTGALIFETRHLQFGIDPATGALNYLVTRADGRAWAAPEHPLALLRYQTFDSSDYARFWDQYIVGKDRESITAWARTDYGKPGMAGKAVRLPLTAAAVTGCWLDTQPGGVCVTVRLAFPPAWTSAYGAPPLAELCYQADDSDAALHMTLRWVDKPASRLPEAFWLSFMPVVKPDSVWQFEKLGTCLDVREMVTGGGARLHGVFESIWSGDRLRLYTPDAALVAPGAPSLLRFRGDVPSPLDGMHVNLFNNVWGTNFPQWNAGDAAFRFTLAWEKGINDEPLRAAPAHPDA
ncbi:MAG: DUF5054 domain-containing protein [bacterium]|nr:DUF5054 domain-containing protein [bacterium]